METPSENPVTPDTIAASKEAEFQERLRRMTGGRVGTPSPCAICGGEMIYNGSGRLVHASGSCDPRPRVSATAPPIQMPRRVRGDHED